MTAEEERMEVKPLAECNWIGRIIRGPNFYKWEIVTVDDAGVERWWFKGNDLVFGYKSEKFKSEIEARADCETFLKRNGWKHLEWKKP